MSWQSDVKQWDNSTGQTQAEVLNSIATLSEEWRRLYDALEEIDQVLSSAYVVDVPSFLAPIHVQEIRNIVKQALNE